MKHIYRISILVILFCAISKISFAAGHTVTIPTFTSCTCFGSCDATASATVSGGVGPFTYSWMPGNLTTASVTGLCAGSYTCTVTDQSDGSTASATRIITQPTALTISAMANSVLCYGSNTGSATVTLTGGNPPYTYNWSPSGGTSPWLTNATAGTYTCAVTDSNGCVAWTTVTITQPPPLTNMVSATPSAICQGQSTTISATPTGGTGSYTFNWNPGPIFGSSAVISPVTTTTYTNTVTDSNGCVATATTTVTVNAGVVANITSNDPTCNQSNGSVTINVTQAPPPYTIAWSNGPTVATQTNLPAGIYSCTVTATNGCTGSFSTGLSNLGGPSVTTSATNTGCTNFSNGTATATPSGIAPFTYSWNTTPVQTTATATNLPMGNYMVTVTDSVGCVTVSSQQVNSIAGNLFMYAYWNSVSNCSQPTGGAATYVQGGTQPYSYLWSNSSTQSTLTGVIGGSYWVTVTDANGCTSGGTVSVPSNCANYVSGAAYLDMNNDTVFNVGDFPLNGRVIYGTPYAVSSSTNAVGFWSRFIPMSGTYDFTMNVPAYYTYESPASGHNIVTFPALGDSIVNIDFAFSVSSPVQDLYLSLASGPARPGFTQQYSIHCENRGTTVVSDTIWFVHDSILSLINSNPVMDGYTHPVGYWVFNNFAPGQQINKNITMQVPTIPNGGYIGRQLFASGRIEPTATDTTSPDNGDDELDIITASCDPNLKECWSPTMNSSGDIWPNDVELDYTIHFQNCGTDTAFFIVVVDTLPAELDITTFNPGASSHPYTWSIEGFNDTNVVTFTFMNILLPDSNVNEAASHGYVQFRINRFANLPIGTQIINNADNYFDFNPPVPTNYSIVTVSNPLVVEGPSGSPVVVYPNPAQNNVNVLLGNEYAGTNATVILFDISGREIVATNTNGSTHVQVNTENCAPGIYIIRIAASDYGVITKQFIISEK